MERRINRIKISDIDDSDRSLRMSFARDSAGADGNFFLHTLLHSPVIWERDGRMSLLCGFRRLAALREMGVETFECVIVSSVSLQEAFQISLHDNVFTRGFNTIEKLMIIRAGKNTGYDLTEFWPFVDKEKSEKFYQRLLPVLEYDVAAQTAVAGEAVSIAAVGLLEKLFHALSPAQRSDLLNRMLNCGCTDAQIRECLEWIKDLSQASQQGWEDIVSRTEGEKEREGISFHAVLKKLRFPVIYSALTEDRKAADRLRAYGLSFIRPKGLEDPAVTLSFTVSDTKRYSTRVEALNTPECTQIVSSLFQKKPHDKPS